MINKKNSDINNKYKETYLKAFTYMVGIIYMVTYITHSKQI